MGRGSGYKNGTHIKNAILKYGWDNFEHLVLIKNLTHEEALKLEEYFIKTFKTQDKKKGYNKDGGGKGGYLSAEAKRKQKEAGCTRDIICLETEKIYSTAIEAAEDMGLVPSSVSKACSSHRYVLFEYHFMYYEEFLKSSKEEINKIKDLHPKNVFNDKRKVIVLETKEVFENAKEAQKVYSSTNINCILCCCKKLDKNRIKAAGVHWMFLKDYELLSDTAIEEVLKTRRGLKACKPVINLSDMKEYGSIEEASKATGVSSKTIRYSCKGTRKTQKKSGKWVFKADYITLLNSKLNGE